MVNATRIAIVDGNEVFKENLEGYLSEIELSEIVVKHYERFNEEILHDYEVLIIDAHKVKSIKELANLIKESTIKKVILLTDRLFDGALETAPIYGFTVFYRLNHPRAIVEKVFTDFNKPLKEAREKQSIEPLSNKMSIAVYSPQGGSGKTTIALSLAHLFAKVNKKVLVVEYSQIAAISAHLQKEHTSKGISKLIDLMDDDNVNHELLKEAISEEITRYERNGIAFDLLLGASIIKMDKISRKHTNQLMSVLSDTPYDLLIFDTQSEITEKNLSLFDAVNQIVMVSTPDISSGWKLLQVKQLFKSIGIEEKCVLTINKFSKLLGFSTVELESELQIPLIGVLPLDMGCQTSLNRGHIYLENADGKARQEYESLANCIMRVEGLDSKTKEGYRVEFGKIFKRTNFRKIQPTDSPAL